MVLGTGKLVGESCGCGKKSRLSVRVVFLDAIENLTMKGSLFHPDILNYSYAKKFGNWKYSFQNVMPGQL